MPVFVAVWITFPFADSVNVFVCPHGAVVAIPIDDVRANVAPCSGWLNEAVNEAVGLLVVPLETVTDRDAVAVCLVGLESVTVVRSVRVPLATAVVFQLNVALVPV